MLLSFNFDSNRVIVKEKIGEVDSLYNKVNYDGELIIKGSVGIIKFDNGSGFVLKNLNYDEKLED